MKMPTTSPGGRQRLRRKIILAVLLVILVCSILFAFSLPMLAEPTSDIPRANLAQNQALAQNLAAKLSVKSLDMFKSGYTQVDVYDSELNAVLYLALTARQNDQITVVGSSTQFSDNKIILNFKLNWHKRDIGLQLVTKPTPANGNIEFLITEVRLGKIPIPKRMVYQLIGSKVALPNGTSVEQQPLRIVVNPSKIAGNVSPLIQEPKLSIKDVALSANKISFGIKLEKPNF